MSRWLRGALAAALCAAALALSGCMGDAAGLDGPPRRQAPEFAGIDAWLNSPPLTLAQLRGKVVLVEFWTWRCVNCMRVLPHTVGWDRKYRDQGLVVIGVHTPETEEEHANDGVQAAIRRFGIGFPVAQDNGYRTWDAYGNFAWPATYLLDRDGRIIRRHYGEGDYEGMEAAIRDALAERR